MQTFYMTDAGKVRTHNEDNETIISNNNNEYILDKKNKILRHKEGEVASNIAIENINQSIEIFKLITHKYKPIYDAYFIIIMITSIFRT